MDLDLDLDGEGLDSLQGVLWEPPTHIKTLENLLPLAYL